MLTLPGQNIWLFVEFDKGIPSSHGSSFFHTTNWGNCYPDNGLSTVPWSFLLSFIAYSYNVYIITILVGFLSKTYSIDRVVGLTQKVASEFTYDYNPLYQVGSGGL